MAHEQQEISLAYEYSVVPLELLRENKMAELSSSIFAFAIAASFILSRVHR
jgi:hypothetical protein